MRRTPHLVQNVTVVVYGATIYFLALPVLRAHCNNIDMLNIMPLGFRLNYFDVADEPCKMLPLSSAPGVFHYGICSCLLW